MKKAAAYARVSGIKQSETSLDTQLNEIRAFADRGGLSIVATYTDKITASGKEERPEFERMIQEALAGAFDFILVYKQDRFHRDNVEEQTIIRTLEKKNVYVISATERIDTSTPAGRLQRWIMSGINRFYLENLQQEVYDKTTLVAKKGYWLGGTAPYGYDVKQVRDPEASRNRKILVPNPEQAAVIKRIFELYAAGEGYATIAQILNQENAKTLRGNPWSKSTIRDTLANKRYAGYTIYRKGKKGNSHAKRDDTIEIPDESLAIVPPGVFDAVQQRLNSTKREYPKATNTSIVRGHIYCGDCGAKMYSSGHQYACGRWLHNRNVKCITIGRKKLESFVLSYIRNKILANVDYAQLTKHINTEMTKLASMHREERERLQQEIANIEERIQNAVDAIIEGSPAAKRLEVAIPELELRKKDLVDKKRMLEDGNEQMILEEEVRRRFAEYERMGYGDDDQKRKLVSSLIHRIVIFENGYIEIEDTPNHTR